MQFNTQSVMESGMPIPANRFIHYDIWLNIAEFLQPHHVLRASMACRSWYRELANDRFWETVYSNYLPGYPKDHFLVPQILEQIQRPHYTPLDGGQLRTLKRWQQSWKQRVVYLAHIICIQTALCLTLRKRTKTIVTPTPPSKSWSALQRINELEKHMATTLPIDLVVFLSHFAQYIRLLSGPTEIRVLRRVGATSTRSYEPLWHKLCSLSQFSAFHERILAPFPWRADDIDTASKDFLYQSKLIPFSCYCERPLAFTMLTVFVSNHNERPPSLPGKVLNNHYLINTNEMANANGKVFLVHWSEMQKYQVYRVSESFTDYLIQFTGVLLEYGKRPARDEVGYNDLIQPLPRDRASRQSVLLPHPHGWSISNYLPTFFTQESEHQIVFRFSPEMFYRDPRNVGKRPIQAFDNPFQIHIPGPPLEMFCGYRLRNWKPYHDLQAGMFNGARCYRLSTYGRDGHLVARKPRRYEINTEIYHLLQDMANSWINSSPSSIGVPRLFSADEKRRIMERTASLTKVFELFKRCLPLSLYYEIADAAVGDIWILKFYQDHLNGLKVDIPKYSVNELGVIHYRFLYRLRALERLLGLAPDDSFKFYSVHGWAHRHKNHLRDLPNFQWGDAERRLVFWTYS